MVSRQLIMLAFVARRLVLVIPLLLLVSVICFALMHAVPGGPAGVLSNNPKLSSDDIARIRSNFGLDESLAVQYVRWLGRVSLHGDFGRSYVTGEPVLSMIAHRIPATLMLMGSAITIALIVAFVVGVYTAVKPDSWIDSSITVISFVVLSIPVFWGALMAMMIFSVKLKWLPAGGMHTIGAPFSVISLLKHLVLPVLVLSSVFVATWSRYLRASLSDTLAQSFIHVARAKGLSERAIVVRHALRNAIMPVVTVVALSLPVLFTGAVVTETVFAWPGLGRLFYDGLLRMDYSRVMGIVFISSTLMMLFNLFAECVHAIVDPRIRHAR